ncbi:hypothetical protein KIN_00480 [Litoreibacter roseus]|uniref:Uncharacterized protein n=2 Tax=Litoreibacter roseus TaxID=2601869 RepID=A0A6N6JAB9_9RHOB|nr:hypothetical protein KIN_00480 [Litoreibacter roseus]
MLVLKAVRGAGAPLGAAEMLARVVPDLSTAAWHELPTALRGPFPASRPYQEGGIVKFTKARVLTCGVAALDIALSEDVDVHVLQVDAPEITCALARYIEQAFGVTLSRLVITDSTDRSIPVSRGSVPALSTADGIPDTVWRALMEFAAKTYVAASEASRSGGAGAGLTDND